MHKTNGWNAKQRAIDKDPKRRSIVMHEQKEKKYQLFLVASIRECSPIRDVSHFAEPLRIVVEKALKNSNTGSKSFLVHFVHFGHIRT
jgi:hypothetical protein